MGKCRVDYACGHVGRAELYGKAADRDRKLGWLKKQDCPECYRAAKHKEDDEQPVTIKIIAPVANVAGNPKFVLVATGGTYLQKDALKILGFKFGDMENETLSDFLSIKRPQKEWYKKVAITPDMLTNPFVLMRALNIDTSIDRSSGRRVTKMGDFGVAFDISALDMETIKHEMAQKQAEGAREAERLEKVGISPLKTWMDKNTPADGKWNGRLYGNEHKGYRVYVSEEEFPVPESVITEYNDWKRNRDKINAEFSENNKK